MSGKRTKQLRKEFDLYIQHLSKRQEIGEKARKNAWRKYKKNYKK